MIDANSLSQRTPAINTVLRPDRASAAPADLILIAADIDEVDVIALQARHDGVKIRALVVGLEHLFGEARPVERLLGLVGEAAVGGLVVEDGDVLAFNSS